MRGKKRLSYSVFFLSSSACGCCPAWAAGRLPGAGHGVRGVPPLHPLHPRTPRLAVTRKLSLSLDCTSPAACRVGHRREPSPACGRGDVRACFGAPSALRAHGIASAPAPSLHHGGAEGVALPEGSYSGEINVCDHAGRLSQRENGGGGRGPYQAAEGRKVSGRDGAGRRERGECRAGRWGRTGRRGFLLLFYSCGFSAQPESPLFLYKRKPPARREVQKSLQLCTCYKNSF